jgi:hypothetical protein
VKHLQIIDEETGAELAELGMTTRERTRACMDCRFMHKTYGHSSPDCAARGGKYIDIHNLNPHGKCMLWEPKKEIATRQSTTLAKTHPFVKIWAWTSLVAILWLLLRGGL